MKNILKTLILTLAALLSINSAFAITPETGWWWNPQESGMGFNIEDQNGTVVIATYVYDDGGNPIWYSGAGQIDENSTVAINLQISRNGPSCPTCPYQAPTTSDAGMPITLQFTSRGEGSVSWQGNTTPIQRFDFNYGTGLQMLIGKWVLMSKKPVDQGQYVGFRITFNSVQGDQVVGKITDEPDTMVTAFNNDNQDPGYQYAAQITNPPIPPVDQNSILSSPIEKFQFNFSGLNKITGVASIGPPVSSSSGETILVPFEAYRVNKIKSPQK